MSSIALLPLGKLPIGSCSRDAPWSASLETWSSTQGPAARFSPAPHCSSPFPSYPPKYPGSPYFEPTLLSPLHLTQELLLWLIPCDPISMCLVSGPSLDFSNFQCPDPFLG